MSSNNLNVKPHEKKWMTALESMAPIFSTCAKRQYASVVLADNKRVVGFGYNGSPSGMAHCTDGACPRMQQNSPNGSNYDTCIAQHAEAGALLWSEPSLRRGATLIVNGPPCMGCAKLIASSGVVRVVYKPDTNYSQWDDVQTFLAMAGVDTIPLT